TAYTTGRSSRRPRSFPQRLHRRPCRPSRTTARSCRRVSSAGTGSEGSMTVVPSTRIGDRRLPMARSRVRSQALDWPLAAVTLAILTIGALLVWSATSAGQAAGSADSADYLKRHLVNIAIGLVLAVVVAV